MSFELFLALRYLRAERKGLFATVTTLIGVAGVTIGVAALVATLSVMNGFQTDIQKRIVGAQAHITIGGEYGPEGVLGAEQLVDSFPETEARAPFYIGHAMAAVQGRSVGAVFKGVDPGLERKVSELANNLTSGSWDGLKEGNPPLIPPPSSLIPAVPIPGAVLGEEMARSLGVWTGDEFTLVSPVGLQTPLGNVPRMQRFKVAGTVRTGYYEYDATFAYIPLESARRLLGPDALPSIAVRLKSLDQAQRVAEGLRLKLGFGAVVRTFADLNRTLFAALKLEKAVMFLILMLIAFVATFNIASNLLLLSAEKARDIGLLRAMGLTPARVRRVFVLVGAIIGAGGVAAGTGLGLLVSWAIGRFEIVELPADIYYLSRVPVDVQPMDVAAVAATAMVFCLAATILPARRAAQVDPLEAIHYG